MNDSLLEKTYSGNNPFYQVGFDSYFGVYLIESDNSQGIREYYTISEDEYIRGMSDISFIDELYHSILKDRDSERFYYANWDQLNKSIEQMDRHWISVYRKMMLGNDRRKNQGTVSPEQSLEDMDIMKLGSFLVKAFYKNDICIDVDVEIERI